jgi:membrane protein DedA with SNARE-associated domain
VFGVEEFLSYLQSVPPLVVYVAVFAVAFVENIFPPSPSDITIVFAGALVTSDRVGFLETFLAASTGSTLGFLAMYFVGDWFGDAILEQGKLKFVSLQALHKVEAWFKRYGYWIIVVNRFLSGTRAVVSFFAGISELNLPRTAALCFVSASAWNLVLLSGGYYFGRNWQRLGFYLSTYTQVVTAIIVLVALILVARYVYLKRNGSQGK